MNFHNTLFKLSFILVIISLFSFRSSKAQTIGSNRPDIEWKILESPAVNVIYTKGYEAKASRIANIINYINLNNTASVGPKFKKVDILLRPETVEPNGYVGLAPFRSEFFTTPPANLGLLGTLDWMDVLAIHEYRHVQQYNNTLHGLTKIGYYFGGQAFWSIFAALSIPNWYFEGDAVIAETALSNAGRGRTPNFLKDMKVLALEDKNYSYMKWRNGSFKDRVPNAYPLGYMMLTHVRNNFGNNTTADVLRIGSSYSNGLFPFSQAMKSKTKMTTTQVFNDAWSTYSKDWKLKSENINLSPKVILNTNSKIVTDYKYPQYGKGDVVYALKSSYQTTSEIVALKNGREDNVTSIGLSIDNYFNHSNGKFVWTEYAVDARRNNLNYSDIYLYNVNEKKKEKITSKGRYFSPTISKDGKTILAIFIDKEQQSKLITIDVSTRKENTILTLEPDAYFYRPVFLEDENSVAFIKKFQSKLSINKVDLSRNEVFELTSPTSHLIDNLSYNNNFIYYNGSYDGIDNIYRCSINEKDKIQQITTVATAANTPSLDALGNNIVFSDHTYKGFQIAKVDLKEGRLLKEISFSEPHEMQWMDSIAAKEEGGNILDKLPSVQYKSKKYGGLFSGMKFHSWSPSLLFLSEPGLTAQFNNILDDAFIGAGAAYNLNEKGMKYLSSVRIAKYYPLIDLQAYQQDRQADFYTSSDTVASQDFKEFSFGGSLAVPLFWINGNYIKSFVCQIGIDQKKITYRRYDKVQFSDLNQTIVRGVLAYSNKRTFAVQNLGPKYGIDALAIYQRALDNLTDEKIYSSSNIFLPGLRKNHSLKLTAAFQKELLTNTFQLADAYQYTRGYNVPTNDEVYNFSVNYIFPLFYPDAGINGITYFKRIKMNLFYDYGNYKYNKAKRNENLSSIGAELIFDNVWINTIPLSYGMRYSYRLDDVYGQKKGGNFTFFAANDF
jgi:hypothetical protein